MAKSIQKIQQNLIAIEEKVASLSLDLHQVYRNYLELLGQSVKRQLITAIYQVCTHAYPESFLKLSVDERSQLQEKFKKLGKDVQEHLLSYVEQTRDSDLSDGDDLEANIPLSALKFEEKLTELESLQTEKFKKIANPEDLMKWVQYLEEGINETLERLSYKANRCLQQCRVLPSKLPNKILEMALQADGEETSINNLPNILNLLIDSEENEELSGSNEDSKITQITAIQLRLTAIEFADPTVSIARNQIRNLLEQLSKIRQQYRQVKRDYATVQAETAWRTSWVED